LIFDRGRSRLALQCLHLALQLFEGFLLRFDLSLLLFDDFLEAVQGIFVCPIG
jgi:hypothetical protein